MHGIRRERRTADQERRKKEREAALIKEYNSLVEKCRQARKAEKYDKDSLDLTTEILTRNPEGYTIWNYRREIFDRGLFPHASKDEIQELIEADLRLVEKTLRGYPKIYWIWNHRRWLLEKAPVPNWKHELGLDSMMLKADPRNFHGWHYRRYVVKNIEISTGKSLVADEFAYTTEKINADFANFSAWYNRGQLIPRYLEGKSNEDRKIFLLAELEKIRHAIYTDPDIQSSWIYQRWLLTTDDIVPKLGSSERARQIENEIQSVSELAEAEPDNKWCVDQLVWLRVQLAKVIGDTLDPSAQQDIKEKLLKLRDIDPMRRKRYEYLAAQY